MSKFNLTTSQKFSTLHKYLCATSVDAQTLTTEQHLECVALCDGYGKRTKAQLVADGLQWDWSHVRDSSDEAISRAYDKLETFLVPLTERSEQVLRFAVDVVELMFQGDLGLNTTESQALNELKDRAQKVLSEQSVLNLPKVQS